MSKTRKYRKVNKLSSQDFKRISGVSKETFKEMLKAIKSFYLKRKSKGGRKTLLSPSDELLMMLEYYREYRTFKHLGVDYEVSESSAHYIVTKIEKILIEKPQFHLSKLKHFAPKNNDNNIDIKIVDVTESQCERPKKSKRNITLEKRKNIL